MSVQVQCSLQATLNYSGPNIELPNVDRDGLYDRKLHKLHADVRDLVNQKLGQ